MVRYFAFALFSLGSFIAPSVDAHGYLKTPRSRNFIAYQDGLWYGAATDKYPKEDCPHCLNIGGTEGRCGVQADTNYDVPKSISGNTMPPDPQISAQRGSQITVDLVLTAHHKGHFEFKACAVSSPAESPSQACFDKNPLTLVRDELYGSMPDESHPTRAYIPPSSYDGLQYDSSGVQGSLYRYTLQLPADAVGGLVLLQWHYLTANSCVFPGYDNYDFPEEWGNMGYGTDLCPNPLPADGRGVPEQFWNCAEMRITDSPVAPTTQAPVTDVSPTTPSPVSEAPVYKAAPTAPSAPVTILPIAPMPSASPVDTAQYCDKGSVGNGICKDPTLCCSEWGWCGSTADYCKDNGVPTPLPISPLVPTTAPTDGPVAIPTAIAPTTSTVAPDPTVSPASAAPTTFAPTIDNVSACVANAHGLANWISDADCQTCQQEFVSYWPCFINQKKACICDEGESPTSNPTMALLPTQSPTPTVPTISSPTQSPTTATPTTTAPTNNPTTATPTAPIGDVTMQLLEALRNSDGSSVFKWQTPASTWEVSEMYTWEDMIVAAEMMLTKGVGEDKLWNGGDDPRYGLVGIAAFLANAMQETIQYNACDENNWSDAAVSAEHGGESYAAVSACGQLGQSYQDYEASPEEDALAISTGVGKYEGQGMACGVDPDMELRAVTHATWYGAPAPLFCAPKSKVPKAPKWNHASPWCAPEGGYDYEPNKFQGGEINQDFFDYINGGGSCRDYSGIQAGGWEFCNGDEACEGVAAPLFGHPEPRTDVEGCCWWGRGVIQTTGVANFGKLNYYLGKRADVEGRDALYPAVDFCERPDSVCDPNEDASIKWVAGFFYHLNAVQKYDSAEWSYYEELKKYVDGGLTNNDFINGVSGIVNRGCHNPPNCGTGELHGGADRRNNFQTVLKAMKLI